MADQVPQSPRKVSRRVHGMDRLAEAVISTGGFLVLAAVLGICFYLVWVVVPLFASGSIEESESSTVALEDPGTVPSVALDPYGNALILLRPDGSAVAQEIRSGEAVTAGIPEAWDGSPVTAMTVGRGGALLAYGHEDGTVRVGSVGFSSRAVSIDDERPEGQVFVREGAVFETTVPGRARRSEASLTLSEPLTLREGVGAVTLIDYRVDPTGKTTLLAVREDGTVVINTVRTIRPLGGGAPRTRLRSTSFTMGDERPVGAFVTADGENVLLVGPLGVVTRFTRVDGSFVFAERFEPLPAGVTMTAANMLLGSQTLLLGDSAGDVRAMHVADAADPGTPDGRALVVAHRFAGPGGAVISLGPSVRDRSLVILGSSGRVMVRHTTSEKVVVEFESGVESPVLGRLKPKNDGVFVLARDGAYSSRKIDPGYPEFSVKALFGRVHYEGQADTSYVYQSSSGDDASEIKLSLMPLIFGTLKATVFAMLFAVPVAVLAAIYTSEFLSNRVRRIVKPGVEMMASLPSVVLGFVAAMVVAPYVRDWLPEVLIGFATVPVSVLAIAHLWQMVPMRIRRQTRSGQHLLMVGSACLAGVGLAVALAPTAERLLFGLSGAEVGEAVDMRRWLNGEYGGAWPGWFIALMTPAGVVTVVLNGILLRRRVDAFTATKTEFASAMIVIGRFVALLGVILGLSALGAWALSSAGFDPRDSIFGTFSPRNTLVVAMIMGFAVIPIIYTIADDSLQAVPNTLRSASLGAGATPWQTAIRVVLPVAGSGIFSACMIGFGRAVGETMIVLMATGNTPEMEWNIFGGFRTLAANIAVELPEAPKGETHYRVLFLCGLVLFVMTFMINTTAEIVRQAVRKRNAGL